MAEAENLPRPRESARRLPPRAGNRTRTPGVGWVPPYKGSRIILRAGGVRDGVVRVSGELATGKPGPAESAPSFEALLTPLLESAYGTALRLTRNPADAEDLVQDAAYLACRGFKTFEAGTNFKAWFFRILTNAFYSKYRKQKRAGTPVELEDTPELYLFCQTAATGLHGQSPDPAGALMDRLRPGGGGRAPRPPPSARPAGGGGGWPGSRGGRWPGPSTRCRKSTASWRPSTSCRTCSIRTSPQCCRDPWERSGPACIGVADYSRRRCGPSPRSGASWPASVRKGTRMSDVDRFTCEEVFHRLDDFLDRELSAEEMRLVREHLDLCEACAMEHRFERRVLDDVKRKLRRIDMPAGLVDRVHAAIERAEREP